MPFAASYIAVITMCLDVLIVVVLARILRLLLKLRK